MAIQFARARYISRSTGGNAVRSAAYNARTAIEALRTNEVFHFKHRDDGAHHEVLLPDGAAERFRDCGTLWNTAEAAEKRRDAQVAREVVLALPADVGLTNEDRIALARSFAVEHFVAQGLAVQLDVHRPHGVELDGSGGDGSANWHAHLLITTRRLEGAGFAARKARDLDPSMRRAAGKNFVADGEAWGELWREHQDRYFREHGLALRVDATATHPGEHIGPVRMRRVGSAAVERAETLRQANEDAARDPVQVLATLTRNNATFDERDLDRHLAKHLVDERDHAAAKAAVLGHASLLALHDQASGEDVARWTTRAVRTQEVEALADGAAVHAAGHWGRVAAEHAAAAAASRSLRPDQLEAFEHAIAWGGLKVIEGRAGTGKSYTLQAVREAHERAGLRVIGLAPTNAVAQDLGRDGFVEAGTVHAALFGLKNGRGAGWDRRTVVVVDEAAMLDSRITGALLAAARASGAKVILSGDDRQLASIERGGLFSELKGRHGSAEIVEVTRQKEAWQRRAARDLAEGRFTEAVQAFDRHGAVTWSADDTAARAALVAAWTHDAAALPADATRFVFAYTNKDVDAFNLELRGVRRKRGELAGDDVQLETAHGALPFAVGDRVQFTATLKAARLYNGNVGTITGIDAATGELRAVLDGSAEAPGREVGWSAHGFEGFRHGYAGTIYKGQGKTLDHTYLHHTHHWRAAASYVALTRQRHSAQVFVAMDTARDAVQLARQMGRGEVKAASVAWATADEVAAATLAARVRVREARLAGMAAATSRQLQAHRAAVQVGRTLGAVPDGLQRRIRDGQVRQVLDQVLHTTGRLVERTGATLARLAGLVTEAWPPAVQLVAERTREATAHQARTAQALQGDIQAGMAAFRARHAARRQEMAAIQRDVAAREMVGEWEGWMSDYRRALPTLVSAPKPWADARAGLIGCVGWLSRQPEVMEALRTRPGEFGMEKRPTLARLLVEPDPKAAVTALLDGYDARQRQAIATEAERQAEIEARQQPRSSPGMSPW